MSPWILKWSIKSLNLSQNLVMETCYEEPTSEETYTTEEVQMRSQAQKQGQHHQGSQS